MRRPLLPLLLLLALLLPVTALAAPQQANYDIYVNAKDNLGLNLRTGAGTEYAKVLPDPIPMYTKLHITQTDTSSTGATWGYTTYDGSSGWVCLVETTTYDPQGNETVVPHEDTEIEMEPALEEVENPANGEETAAGPSGVTVNVNVNGDSDDTGDSTNSSAKTLLLGAAGGVVVALLAFALTAATRKKKD